MKTLTVFTPTYNRAYCLRALYESLCAQTNKDFEWLIVDDGSSDNTRELVQAFIEENKIQIKYHAQTNSGKHVAHNKGVELCETELFVCVDSDDALTANAVDVILHKYEAVKNQKILGLYLRKQYPDGRWMASAYPKGIEKIGITDLYHNYPFTGDTVIVLKTELIKPYSFPVFEGERFVTEKVLYNQLNHIAPMLLCDEAIYTAEYLPDGYTKNIQKLIANNPQGVAVDCLFESFYHTRVLERLKGYAQYRAVVNTFKLKKETFKKYNKASFLVKAGAWLLMPHYLRLYKRLGENK